MRLLALDISTNTGWAFFRDGFLENSGVINCKDPDIDYEGFSVESMASMILASYNLSTQVLRLIRILKVDKVVIEQTNKGRSRYTQKLLEWMHFRTIMTICGELKSFPYYLDSSQWRKAVDLKMSKEDRKHNATIKKTGKRGKIGKKHLSVRMVNDLFNLGFKMKDNDKADAILLGVAYLKEDQSWIPQR